MGTKSKLNNEMKKQYLVYKKMHNRLLRKGWSPDNGLTYSHPSGVVATCMEQASKVQNLMEKEKALEDKKAMTEHLIKSGWQKMSETMWKRPFWENAVGKNGEEFYYATFRKAYIRQLRIDFEQMEEL
jgi:hypothetical protein